MTPKNLYDLARMLRGTQLRMVPRFMADGTTKWTLMSLQQHEGRLYPAFTVEMGRTGAPR